ncbi:MAG: hypothetical protein J1F43_02595 [Muribaculaceae bacterium]|nr:hypothetical protein [Muribaculaceae bacterium]
MSARLKKLSFWLRRKSHLPLILIGSLMVLVLFFNDETSLALNMKYEKEINNLTVQIKECRDSAAYYRQQREAILHDSEDLERLARERFHMQRPTEDVYILK